MPTDADGGDVQDGAEASLREALMGVQLLNVQHLHKCTV